MTSDILIHGKFSVNSISALLHKKLAGQQISENVYVSSIKMKADADWLYAVMMVSGRHNGTLVAKFKLQTVDSEPDLSIDQLEISLESDAILATVVNWVLRNLLGEKIESKVQSVLHKSLSTMIVDMSEKYGVLDFDGVTINSDLKDYNFEEISWTDTHIMCTFRASGVLRVELE